MAQEQQLPEIKLDATQLYREEIFTDRKAGTLRRLVPVQERRQRRCLAPGAVFRPDAAADAGRRIAAGVRARSRSLEDACNKFPDAVKIAIEQAIEEAREMRREAASRIVVPDAGGGMGGPPPRGGRIKL